MPKKIDDPMNYLPALNRNIVGHASEPTGPAPVNLMPIMPNFEDRDVHNTEAPLPVIVRKNQRRWF